MSILVFAENSEGTFKKSVLEAITYARHLAASTGDSVVAAYFGDAGNGEIEKLSRYGVSKIVAIKGSFSEFHPQSYSKALSDVAAAENATVVVISNTYSGKSIAPRMAVRLNAALATNVVALPDLTNGFVVKRGVFSGKGFAYVNLSKTNKILALTPNSIEVSESPVAATQMDFNAESGAVATQITGVNKVSGKIPLTEAEIVVSAGRGMKGPENWHMVETLAQQLGAATACSKPVSDMGWRPHSEHVGQTGITIKPNLYIAIGISGAIQHLAGVSSSKVIVVVNKDPEAPFFKAADYGIVGDAFEVLPKLIDAAKSAQN